jgi:hypothetical protein
VDAGALAGVLLTAPLTGNDSIFGNRPGSEVDRTERSRRLREFSPAPGFRFDVDLMQGEDGEFIVSFSQPDRRTPYLQGDVLWSMSDEADGAVFDEQINTGRALQTVDQPLSGPRPSARRWLFFRVGHKQVMDTATGNIATLLSRR